MIFSSMVFIFAFLPIVFCVYFFLPKRFQNYWLLITSLFFYAWGEASRVWILVGCILLNYFAALKMEECSGRIKKLILIITLAINLSILFVFKYLNFTTINLHRFIPATQDLFGLSEITLPIGISFFTFQAISYVVDVYRGKEKAQKKVCYLGLYISLFPQLIAGPIVRYSTIANQIEHREVHIDSFTDGVFRFLRGLNKKVLLANVLANVADAAFGSANLSVGMAWIGIICYAMQIYFDFSGYSDMAIGMGKMAGFRFLENFNLPYQAKSISDFWRRWHISLGSWFRDYVYFPLGGSRVRTKGRLVLNLMIVWLLTGIWHGADWTFFLWGIGFGLLISFEKVLGIEEKIKKKNWMQFLYQLLTLFLLLLGWVLFRADHLSDSLTYFSAMFGLSNNMLFDTSLFYYLKEYSIYIMIGLGIVFWPYHLFKSPSSRVKIVLNTVQILLFLFSVSNLVMQTNNPFVYFNF